MMETERLLLRPWCEDDAPALFKYASDPEVGPRAGWPPHTSVEESREIIRTLFSGDHMWAIEWKETGEPIGCIGYFVYGESNINIGENDAEAGYWIARPYWNRGICSEALRMLIDYCFNEKGFRTLWSDYFPDNPASGRVMEKCGFRDTGEFNHCSQLQIGSNKPVKIMRLDNINDNNDNEDNPSKQQQKNHPCGVALWSVGDSNSRPLPCEGSALNQLS